MNATANSSAALGWSRLPAHYAIPSTPPTLAEAREYCARLARTHYENFSVASWFLPQPPAPAFLQRLRLLPHLRRPGRRSRRRRRLPRLAGSVAVRTRRLLRRHSETSGVRSPGRNRAPVRHSQTRVLRPAHRLPPGSNRHPLRNFQRRAGLLPLLRESGRPSRTLPLRIPRPDRQHLSDFTCTALQLANFWQDVSVDYEKGRIYLPLEDLRRFNVSQRDIADHQNTPAFCAMMKFEVERARDWFRQGLPLV